MKYRLKFEKSIVYRVLTFSLTFMIGLTIFLLIPCFQEKHERASTYILPAEIFDRRKINDETCLKPNPLILYIRVDENWNVTLNRKPEGNLHDTLPLETILSKVFRERADNGVFRINSNEVEKQVHIRFDNSIEYGELVKLVETLDRLGANPIIIIVNNDYCPGLAGGSGSGYRIKPRNWKK